jgi:hypothetical protein
MIDGGLMQLISTNAGVIAAGGTFGSFLQLQTNNTYPGWTYENITDDSDSGLQFVIGMVTIRWQVDCFGSPSGQGNDAIALAEAIRKALVGFVGTLPDVDETQVNFCKLIDKHDFFDSAARSFRRMIEFEVIYFQV